MQNASQPLDRQITDILREVEILRSKAEGDARTIAMLKDQHMSATAQLRGLNQKHSQELERQRAHYEDWITELTTAKELADQRAQEVSEILNSTANFILQAGRAMKADLKPKEPAIVADQEPGRTDSQRLLDSIAPARTANADVPDGPG